MILVCAHAGVKTGEDGPTHADPQALQLLQENFPRGTLITLTPWDPQELWTLVSAALAKRPAVIAPFVTRPSAQALPLLKKEGMDLNAYYVSSAELFDLLSPMEKDKIFPEARAQEAMGITGFTLPTMDRWLRSERARRFTLHPFQKGHYLGSGRADQG